jgi:adenylate kinase family enzyme
MTGSSIDLSLTSRDYRINAFNGHTIFMHRSSSQSSAMKRIVIVGSSGSGKSTLARQLSQQLNLPLYHLDKYFWHAGWVGTPFQTWQQTVRSFVTQDEWILDGNYRSTLDMRIKAADTIIFLDLPPWLCTLRAIKRRIQYRNRPRPDMAEGCPEHIIDRNFPRFLTRIWTYPTRARTAIVQRLHAVSHNKRIVWLQSTREVDQFLADPHGYRLGAVDKTSKLSECQI